VAADDLPLVPARILNEHVYCPRLAWLEWSEREFRHNAETAEGDYVHRRVDKARGRPPPAADVELDGETRPPTTSVSLDAPLAGISARIDLLRLEDGLAIPVEYKRGSPRAGGEVVWAPERVQLAAYAVVLREHGYRVERGEVWFAETRTRHVVELSDEDDRAVADALAGVRAAAARDEAPPPLIDSPKCPRCSLVGLCLPDEVNQLRGRTARARRLVAPDPVATPLYATTPGARITKRGGRVVLTEHGVEVSSRRLLDVAHIAVFGNVDVGSALLRECFEHGIPVLWLTSNGWFSGAAFGPAENAVALRMRQHRAAALGRPDIAAAMIAGKIRNQRTLLRRHGGDAVSSALGQLAGLAAQAADTRSVDSLLGFEGTAARIYFSYFGSVLHGDATTFDFEARNRRPARDPVNAVLSFVYSS
jgi:CRISPR-associated protein Cas1